MNTPATVRVYIHSDAGLSIYEIDDLGAFMALMALNVVGDRCTEEAATHAPAHKVEKSFRRLCEAFNAAAEALGVIEKQVNSDVQQV